MTETPAPLVPVESIRKALTGYRIFAWTTGLWLILLCYEMVAKYVYNIEGLNWIAVVHGWVYFVYLIFTANLAVKVRWPIAKTIGALLAGTIPLVGIIVEHFQTRDIKAKFGIVAGPAQPRCLITSSASRSPRSSCRKCDAPSILTCSPAVGMRSQNTWPAFGYGKI